MSKSRRLGGVRKLFALAATGALTYFLDPDEGAHRRSQAVDRLTSLLRRGKGAAEQKAGSATSKVHGIAQRAAHPQSSQAPVEDDATLTDKVETEIFRDRDVPQGQINVNTEHGRVVLRGEVPSEDMKARLEKQARLIPGVADVENLLHLPGEPAPHSTPLAAEEVKAELREPSPSTGFGQSASSSDGGGDSVASGGGSSSSGGGTSSGSSSGSGTSSGSGSSSGGGTSSGGSQTAGGQAG
jgi:hypothetical protein